MPSISTSALAKQLEVQTKDLFSKLLQLGYIVKDGENWKLTDLGKTEGGKYQESEKFGRYIVWPENLQLNKPTTTQTITATTIGKHFNVSANKVNFILSELGWVKKDVKGWLVTKQGKMQGAVQSEDKNSGIPYVRWPEKIIASKSLIQTMMHVSGEATNGNDQKLATQHATEEVTFREKFKAKHRAADGHFVRSKAEMLIDNYLYMAEIIHAYERKLPIEEDLYCDFYIPTKKVYIEYWGYENDEKYLNRKKEKIQIYEKYGFKLIQLQDKDVQNLDDILPKLLLKYGITAY